MTAENASRYLLPNGESEPQARGYFKGEEMLACHDANITAYVPKPMTSNAKADGRFKKATFVYDATIREYTCLAGEVFILSLL